MNTEELRKLLADLRGLRAHHAWTRDNIGQPGCEVRKAAAEYVETLDRAIAALANQGWQDIASAPKDGSDVLLADAKGYVASARYYGGWWETNSDPTDYADRPFEAPTAWMPLPPPPAAEGEGR